MKLKGLLTVMILGLAVAVVGCSKAPQSANSSEAIKQADNLQTVEEKAQFLIKEANAFLNSEQFEEAINTAKYVLDKLDKESAEAKGIIEQAKVKLEAMAQEKAEEMKGKLQEKIDGIGN